MANGAEEVTSADFEEKVLKAKDPVLVDFFAHWCGPCQILIPLIDKASQKYTKGIIIYKVDIEKNPELTSKYSVLSVPTLIFFKSGKPIDQYGFLSEDQLNKKIEEIIA